MTYPTLWIIIFRNDTRAFVKKGWQPCEIGTFNDKIFSKMTLRSNLKCSIQTEQANNQTLPFLVQSRRPSKCSCGKLKLPSEPKQIHIKVCPLFQWSFCTGQSAWASWWAEGGHRCYGPIVPSVGAWDVMRGGWDLTAVSWSGAHRGGRSPVSEVPKGGEPTSKRTDGIGRDPPRSGLPHGSD